MSNKENFNIDNALAKIDEAEKQLNDLKKAQRSAALAHVKKIINTFQFSTEELAIVPRAKSVWQKGSVKMCQDMIKNNPNISREDYNAWAKSQNIKSGTYSSQYHKIVKSMID